MNQFGMHTYMVTYDISADPNANANRGFLTQTNMSNLKISIPARSGNDAQMIVENMFGGPLRCRAYGAIPLD
jgi:hypothetical protein